MRHNWRESGKPRLPQPQPPAARDRSRVARKPHIDALSIGSGTASRPGRFDTKGKAISMASSNYYHRQSDLCLQLSLLQADPRATLMLVNLATELLAKADEPESALVAAPSDLHDESATSPDHGLNIGVSAASDAPKTESPRVRPPDPPPRHPAPEIPQV
jgi:hypothetical protein